jgi:hypothetical protein
LTILKHHPELNAFFEDKKQDSEDGFTKEVLTIRNYSEQSLLSCGNADFSLIKQIAEKIPKPYSVNRLEIIFNGIGFEKTITQHCVMKPSHSGFDSPVGNYISYSREKYGDENGVSKVRLVLRSKDNSVDCGCRFKYIAPMTEMSYTALVDAINEAIDKEAAETNGEYVTNDRNIVSVVKTLDYDALLNDFNNLAAELMGRDPAAFGPKITFIVDKYLGRGKKVSDSTPAQVELLEQIVAEIKDTLL